MSAFRPGRLPGILLVSGLLLTLLLVSVLLALSLGSSRQDLRDLASALVGTASADPLVATIIWDIRLPRVAMAGLVGAGLSLAGLVFQALLRNPLAEPYILGVSGGSAVGAIIGLLAGFSRFPGVAALAFLGGMATLVLVLFVRPGHAAVRGDALLLSGVMVNAFFSAVIMFLVSVVQDSRLHSILFWLMGDMSAASGGQVLLLAACLIPCFCLVFAMARPLNLLLMGEDTALSLGVNVRTVSWVLLAATSFMVSATVCNAGLVGFVGLVVPHMLRSLIGPDHRLLTVACILGGASFVILCDLLSRYLPAYGEMPVGVITALIGAPIFILLLRRSAR
jgi:iron complex transport system permease protein